MRRIAVICLLSAVAGALVATSASGEGGAGGDYLVRAYFDNAGFLVKGEQVRVAGATVGAVDSVDVTRPGEAVTKDGSDDPGKAVVVMRIDDAGFQDFRVDASCLIRPQSLLGEKYVDCVPTQPRAPGSAAPPELEAVPDGELGAGQLRLPLENNGKAVDLDLINNITREPEIDRFRLIINDLGAGLAARGTELGNVIERANPALQQTDKVLAILAEQNHGLAQLTRDSDQILAPLARERRHVAGFIRNAAAAGAAAAERRADISAGLRNFPPALRELQSSMIQLRRFAVAATPVATDLSVAAPSLARATRELKPFSRAGTIALKSLGNAAAASGADLAASDPVIRQLGRVGKANTPAAQSLDKLLRSLRKTGGIDYLMAFILNSSNSFNGFDDYGHFLRAALQISNCVDIRSTLVSGCGANFTGGQTAAAATAPAPPPTARTLAGSPGARASENDHTAPKPSTSARGGLAPGAKGLFDFLLGNG